MSSRECTDRHCGMNPRRKVNPRDYDSVMGFLCDRCTDAENEDATDPRCSVCECRKSEHGTEFPCRLDEQDEPCPCSPV